MITKRWFPPVAVRKLWAGAKSRTAGREEGREGEGRGAFGSDTVRWARNNIPVKVPALVA